MLFAGGSTAVLTQEEVTWEEIKVDKAVKVRSTQSRHTCIRAFHADVHVHNAGVDIHRPVFLCGIPNLVKQAPALRDN
jgi:hypothetical protein